MHYPTIEDTVGNTPLVRLQRLTGNPTNLLLAKLESHNPAGSVKDRPARSMIQRAQERGEIKPGDTLIEPTSGNTGIALAMVAAMRGYRMVLIMPDNMSVERRAVMKAYGAELILVPKAGGMEAAIDLAHCMAGAGEGKVLDQFANPDNPLAHYEGTGPEIWRDTRGEITHFVSAMGTTGTIMGTSRYLKEKNPAVQIIGVQPGEGASIPAFGAGSHPMFLQSTIRLGLISFWMSPKSRPKKWPADWAARKVFSVASRLVAPCVPPCVSPSRFRMPPSSPLSATAAIVIFQPMFSPDKLPLAGFFDEILGVRAAC